MISFSADPWRTSDSSSRRDRPQRRWACRSTPRRRPSAGCGWAQEATVTTSMIVREDSMTLYGFGSSDEREVFDVLLSVSGVGPRLALAVLAVHGARGHPGGAYPAGTARPSPRSRASVPRWPAASCWNWRANWCRTGPAAPATPLRGGRVEAAGDRRDDQPGLVRKGRRRQHRQGHGGRRRNWPRRQRRRRSCAPRCAGWARTAPAPETG